MQIKIVQEHKQLAEWLLELKRFRVNTKKSNKNDAKNKFAIYDYEKVLAITDTYEEAEHVLNVQKNMIPQYNYGLVKISPCELTN